MSETHGDARGIKCPWCGHFIRDLWDGLMPDHDGDTTGTWCGDCDKPVNLTAHYTYAIEGSRGKEKPND